MALKPFFMGDARISVGQATASRGLKDLEGTTLRSLGLDSLTFIRCAFGPCEVTCKVDCRIVIAEYPKALADIVVKRKTKPGAALTEEESKAVQAVKKRLTEMLDKEEGRKKLLPPCLVALSAEEGVLDLLKTDVIVAAIDGLIGKHPAAAMTVGFTIADVPRLPRREKDKCFWDVTMCSWMYSVQPDEAAVAVLRAGLFAKMQDNASLKQFIETHESIHLNLETLIGEISCAALKGKTIGEDERAKLAELADTTIGDQLATMNGKHDERFDEGVPTFANVTKDNIKTELDRGIKVGNDFVDEATKAEVEKDKPLLSADGAKDIKKKLQDQTLLGACGAPVTIKP